MIFIDYILHLSLYKSLHGINHKSSDDSILQNSSWQCTFIIPSI